MMFDSSLQYRLILTIFVFLGRYILNYLLLPMECVRYHIHTQVMFLEIILYLKIKISQKSIIIRSLTVILHQEKN